MLKGTEVEKAWKSIYYGNEDTYVVAYMSLDSYKRYVIGYKSIGRPGETGGMFVCAQTTAEEMENAITSGTIGRQTKKYKTELATQLGLPTDTFKSGVVKVKIPRVESNQPRMVKGIEDGCNEQWIPGGKTLGGMPEAMVNQITELDNREIYNWITEHAEGKKLS